MSPLGSTPYADVGGGLFTTISVDGAIPSSSLNGTLNRGTVPQVVAVAAVNLVGVLTRRSTRLVVGALTSAGALTNQKLRAILFFVGATGFTATVNTAARKVMGGALVPVAAILRRRIRQALRFLGKAGIVSRG